MTQKLLYQKGDQWADIPLKDGPGNLKAIISLERAGNMSYHQRHELADRSNLIKNLNITPDRFFYLHQKHTQKVVTITESSSPDDINTIEADGLFTLQPNAVLSITIADCLPLFLYHKSKPAFAIVHSGWKGTGIAANALKLFQEQLHAPVHEIGVTIGPGIGACCYDVDEKRAEEFQKKYGPQVAKKQKNRYYLDLREANLSLLRAKGVETFTIMEDCTACSPDLHSYRRQGPENFKLMAAVIGFF